MLVTLPGIERLLRLRQPEKALLPIVVSVLGKLTFDRPEQCAKAAGPISANEFGRLRLVRPLQPVNVSSAMRSELPRARREHPPGASQSDAQKNSCPQTVARPPGPQSNNALLLVHFELIHRPKCSRNRNTQANASPQKWPILTRNSLAGSARKLTASPLIIRARKP